MFQKRVYERVAVNVPLDNTLVCSRPISSIPTHPLLFLPYRRGKRIITNYDALVGVAVAAATNATASPEPWSTDRSIPSRGDTSSTSNIKTWRDGMQGTPSERESHQHWTSWEVTECRLEDMDFSEQVKVLRRTDVLVAQYGTGKS